MKTKRTRLTFEERQTIKKMMNHINSYSRENFDNKCPIEVFEEIYGTEILKALEVTRITPNDIMLLPELLNQLK